MSEITLDEKTRKAFVEHGREGGLIKLQKHGRDHFSEMGKRSAAKKDKTYYSMMGKKSAEARRKRKLAEKRAASPINRVTKLLGGN